MDLFFLQKEQSIPAGICGNLRNLLSTKDPDTCNLVKEKFGLSNRRQVAYMLVISDLCGWFQPAKYVSEALGPVEVREALYCLYGLTADDDLFCLFREILTSK